MCVESARVEKLRMAKQLSLVSWKSLLPRKGSTQRSPGPHLHEVIPMSLLACLDMTSFMIPVLNAAGSTLQLQIVLENSNHILL